MLSLLNQNTRGLVLTQEKLGVSLRVTKANDLPLFCQATVNCRGKKKIIQFTELLGGVTITIYMVPATLAHMRWKRMEKHFWRAEVGRRWPTSLFSFLIRFLHPFPSLLSRPLLARSLSLSLPIFYSIHPCSEWRVVTRTRPCTMCVCVCVCERWNGHVQRSANDTAPQYRSYAVIQPYQQDIHTISFGGIHLS